MIIYNNKKISPIVQNKKISKRYIGDKLVFESALRLKSLPVGTKIKDLNSTFNGVPVIWIVGEHNHYGEGQTVLISEKVLQFMCFDAKESGGASDRSSYGNNNYEVSNIDQWLNSDAAESLWYSARHTYDQSPNYARTYNDKNEYDNKPGFLNGFSENFKSALIAAKIPYKQPKYEGGNLINISRKVFLPSAEEIGLSAEGEGSVIEYFNAGVAGAYPTAEAAENSEHHDGTYADPSKYAMYRLRTRADSSSNTQIKAQSNTLEPSFLSITFYTHAYYGSLMGARPLVNIDSSIKISSKPDSDGVYIIA